MTSTTSSSRAGWTVAALAAAGVVVLATQSMLQPVAAAPVPAAQAGCPPQADPRPAAAKTTSYARLDGIPGESTRAGVAGQIVLTSIRTSMLGGGSTLCGAAGKTVFDPIVVEKRVDKASPVLQLRAADGKHIASARLSVWAEGAKPRQFLTYDLSDVTVQSVRQVQRGDSLTEEVSLGYSRVKWAYTPVNANGTPGAAVTACWDLARNQSC